MSSVIFPGQYIIGHHCHLSFHCAIEDDDSVVLTGGHNAWSLVTRYDVKGEATHLPSLKTGRMCHACGTYKTVESVSNPNEQVGCR